MSGDSDEADLNPNYQSLTEISASVGVKSGTLGAAIQRGQLRGVKFLKSGKEIWKVSETELRRWLEVRSEGVDLKTPLEGTPLPIAQAAKQFKVSQSFLQTKIRAGLLAAQNRPTSSGRTLRFVGSEDVRKLLEKAEESIPTWTTTRVALLAGIERIRVYQAVQRGLLPTQSEPGRPYQVFAEVDVAHWLENHCPPYCPEVAGLKPALSLQEARELTQLAEYLLEKAIEDGSLRAFQGSRVLIPRQALDAWLAARGLPSSASLEREREQPIGLEGFWGLQQVADFVNTTLHQVTRAIQSGKLVARRVHQGETTRVEIDPPELLRWLEKRSPGDFLNLYEAARMAQLSVEQLSDSNLATAQFDDVTLVSRRQLDLWLSQHGHEPLRDESGYLELSEAARVSATDRRTLQNWLASGRLSFKQQGRRKLVKMADLESILAGSLSIKDCALLAQCSEGTVRDAIRRGELSEPYGASHQVERESFAKWLEELRASLTLEQAIQQSGLKRARLEKALEKGELPARRCGGSRVYAILPRDLEVWLTLQKNPETELLTVEQAAQMNQVRASQFTRAIRKGELAAQLGPAPTGGPQRYLLKPDAVKEWLEKFPSGLRPRLGRIPSRVPQSERPRVHGGGSASLAGTADGVAISRAAELAGCSTSLIHNCLRRGTLKAVGMRDGCLYLERASLDEWLESRPTDYDTLAAQGELLTIMDMARLTKLDRATINKAITQGHLRATRVCRRGAKGPPIFVALMADFRTWLAAFNSRFETNVKLRGEPLNLQEAAEIMNVKVSLLAKAVSRGQIPSRRRLGAHRVAELVVGREDLEDWAAARRAPDLAWTRRRIAALLGVSIEAIRFHIRSGALPLRLNADRRRQEVDPADLALWMTEKMPPYRSEVTGLSTTLSQGQVTRELEIDKSQVLSALISGDLQALRLVEPGGPRYIIPRASVDRWCLSQGWPQTFQRKAPELVPLPQVQRLTGVSTTQLIRALEAGQLEGQRRGRHWLVKRTSMDAILDLKEKKALGAILSVEEAASLRASSESTIRTAIKQGKLPAQKVRDPGEGRTLAIERRHLDDWNEPPPALTLRGAAIRLGISESVMARGAREGSFPTVRRGRNILVELADVKKWLEQRQEFPQTHLTVEEVSERFGVSPSQVRAAIHKGQLAFVPRLRGAKGGGIPVADAQRCHQEHWQPVEGECLGIGEASRWLKMRLTAVRAAIRAGELAATLGRNPATGKKRWFIRKGDLERFREGRHDKG